MTLKLDEKVVCAQGMDKAGENTGCDAVVFALKGQQIYLQSTNSELFNSYWIHQAAKNSFSVTKLGNESERAFVFSRAGATISRSGLKEYGISNVIAFAVMWQNDGGYNNGVFTCRISGTYLVSVSIDRVVNSGDEVRLPKNGDIICSMKTTFDRQCQRCALFVSLTEGDHIYVHTSHTITSADGAFAIVLISPGSMILLDKD